MKVDDLARQIELDPHWWKKELWIVKERYLFHCEYWNDQLTDIEQREEWKALGKAAMHLENLISRAKHPFLKPTLQDHWDPDCSTEDLLSMLRGIKKLTGMYAGKGTPSEGRRNRRHPDCLLHLLCEAWENLTNMPPNVSSRFHDFIHFSCDYMELDSKGLWERHRKQHAQR